MTENRGQRNRFIIATAIAGAMLVCAFGAAAWYVAGSTGAAASITGAADESYEPTSEWVEEGVDPDVMQLGFDGTEDEGAAEPAIESSGRGELSEPALHNMMIAKQNEMMPCYVDTLNQNPEASGTVDMRFGIAPDGHVVMVKVIGSTLRDRPMEDCLVEKSRRWAFPATGRATLMKFETDFSFVTE